MISITTPATSTEASGKLRNVVIYTLATFGFLFVILVIVGIFAAILASSAAQPKPTAAPPKPSAVQPK